jgi:DNA-binding phage protein
MAVFLDAPLFDQQGYALKLRIAMATANISYRDLAPAIGVSHATLHRTATARGLPDVETYLRINKWLGEQP